MCRRPSCNEYILLLMSRRSEQDFTGRKRDRGTLMRWALRKSLITPPTAVSSCRKLEYVSKSPYQTTNLNHSFPVVGQFRVNDDIELHATSIHDPLQC